MELSDISQSDTAGQGSETRFNRMRESTYGRQGGRKCVYTVLGSLGAAAAVCVLAAVVLLATAPAPEIRVIKPPNDNREYKATTLPNGLQVLMISDPETTTSAAAMDVHVGSLADPEEYQGLAHFLEHMLFMGTEKYPDENGYSEYLNANGGGSNAYTDQADTNYFFSVDSSALEGALDRFAQFFIAPLLKPDATQREMHAVDSEHKKNLQSDGWRLFQMLKESSDANSKFHQFGTGDLETLNKPGVRDALVAFHQRYYSANQMRLCIYGKESIADLERLVNTYFIQVPNTDAPGPAAVPNPFSADKLGRIVKISPVSQMQQLQLYWPVSSVWADYLATPSSYLTHAIGDEGAGSLLSYLKAKNLAEGVSAGLEVDERGFAMFSVSVSLTQAVAANADTVNTIIADVYAYINMLRKPSGVAQWLWHEINELDEIDFRFSEKSSPSGTASSLARALQRVAPEFVLDPPSAQEFKPTLINAMLAKLVPDNNLIFWVSSALDATTLTSTEPIYGTKFLSTPVAADTMATWTAASLPSDSLHLPAPNPYIPTHFDIVAPPAEGIASNSTPTLAVNDASTSTVVWWLQDVMFHLPKISMQLIATSEATTSARDMVLRELYASAVDDALQEAAYPAAVAGYGYGVVATSSTPGIEIMITGYSDPGKLAKWANTVAGQLASPAVADAAFQIWKERMQQIYTNARDQQPYSIALSRLATLQASSRYTIEELKAALAPLTPNDLKQYIPQLRAKMAYEAFVHGNIGQADAAALVKRITDKLAAQPLANANSRRVQIGMFPTTSHVYQLSGPNPDNLNSAVVVSFQLGLRDRCNAAAQAAAPGTPSSPAVLSETCIVNSLAIDLLGQLISEPAFNQLRTKEQLGYVVFAFVRASATTGAATAGNTGYWSDAVRSLHVLVQGSTSNTAADIDGRIEAFLTQFQSTTLANVDDAKWASVVSAMKTDLTKPPLTMADLTNTVFNEIAAHTYQFTRMQQQAALLDKATLAQVQKLFNDLVMTRTTGSQTRRVSVELWGSGTTITAPTGAAAATAIPDATAFAQGLPKWQ